MLNPDGADAYTRVNANLVDLNRDAQNLSQPESKILRNAFNKIKPDFILHYASEIFDTYKKSQININNIDGTLNLVKAAKKYKTKKFIFTSTFSIFEKNYENLIDEIEPISCSNYYGLSKAETERILLSTEKKC